ncbi:MAG: anti-sigma factor [Solirubrobacterales bacterium]
MSDAHDHWSEDLAAYLLGALEPDAVAELERHAEDCERCRSEMRWLTPAVEALPEAVARRQPPPRLRARLMEEVRADARAAGTSREPGSGSFAWKPLAGLAAVVLIVAAFAGYEVGNGGGGGGGGARTVVAGVNARVVSEGGHGEIHLSDVEKLPQDRVLEAWVRRDGEVEPVKALFVPDREGNASTMLGSMRGVDLVMVTTEPVGGSPAPTSSPIAEVSIPQ